MYAGPIYPVVGVEILGVHGDMETHLVVLIGIRMQMPIFIVDCLEKCHLHRFTLRGSMTMAVSRTSMVLYTTGTLDIILIYKTVCS